MGACEAPSPSPISVIEAIPTARPEPVTTYKGRTALAKEGDNLYSIAFEAGFDAADVARWNNLDLEDVILVGQEVRLYPQPDGESQPRDQSPSVTEPIVNPEVASVPAKKPVIPTKNTPKKIPAATSPTTVAVVPAAVPEKSPPKKVPAKGPSKWIWPTRGDIITKFSEKQQKNGIAITGKSGTPVGAAADGRVVYAGSGLIGFGRIIIVKHSDEFLSVYAHNSRIVVSEGDMVAQGQKIAEMGNTDADRVKLHFEIRRYGKPVDPLTYLPKG